MRGLRQDRRGISANLMVTLGIVVAAVAMLTIVVIANRSNSSSTAATGDRLVRADSQRLSTAADGKVTLVEFLDFECEACGAAYPGVEKLREEYNGKFNYVVRYFPISSHKNAFNAALAAQSAANQGKFEEMYVKLFTTQKEWAEQQDSKAAVFEGFARDLGLDVNRFKSDVAAKATSDRVKSEQEDGVALGVQGTPTFFINGQKFEGQPTYDGLKAAVDAELAK